MRESPTSLYYQTSFTYSLLSRIKCLWTVKVSALLLELEQCKKDTRDYTGACLINHNSQKKQAMKLGFVSFNSLWTSEYKFRHVFFCAFKVEGYLTIKRWCVHQRKRLRHLARCIAWRYFECDFQSMFLWKDAKPYSTVVMYVYL